MRPSKGTIRFLGQEFRSWHLRNLARHRSVLLQANEVSFTFTVRQVVKMGRSPWWGHDDVEADEYFITDALERTDTTHLLDRSFSTLSGGEKARVSLARVLAQNAEVVLLDEPTAALDLRHQEDVMTLARETATEGGTVVVVMHDLTLAAPYADEIALIDEGRLAAQGPPGVAPSWHITTPAIWAICPAVRTPDGCLAASSAPTGFRSMTSPRSPSRSLTRTATAPSSMQRR